MLVVIELEVPEPGENELPVGEKIHNILNGNPDYVDSSIVLDITTYPESPHLYAVVAECDKLELSAASEAVVDMLVEIE
jgi:hypothetical protein